MLAALLCLTPHAVAAQVAPLELVLPGVEAGATVSSRLELSNPTVEPLTASLVSGDADLTVDPERVELPAGGSAEVLVTFTPDETAAGGALRLITVLFDRASLAPETVLVRATVTGSGTPTDARTSPASGTPAAGGTPATSGTHAAGGLVVDLYMDASCPSCRELARETLPRVAAEAGVSLTITTHDIMDPDVTERLLAALSLRGGHLDELPVAFVYTDPAACDPAHAIVFQGFQGIEDGVGLVAGDVGDLYHSDAISRHGTARPATTAAAAGTAGSGSVAGSGSATDSGSAAGAAASALSAGAVITAGLVDGINPCAFSTMLFLISMLALVGRSRREILVIGSVYSATVFGGYLAAGFGLFASVRALMVFPVVVASLRWFLAGLLVLLAVLSARDAVLARAGRTREMVLQLPEKMKRRVHGVVRSGARRASLIGGTIVLGLGVTVFEFSCTGQVYVPVIMHLARGGSSSAIGLLVVYNVAFIVPLLVVFGLAYAGVSMKRLGSVFERNVPLVKVGLAIVFAGLAALTILV